MKKAMGVLGDNLNTIRTGRANPAILDRIMVRNGLLRQPFAAWGGACASRRHGPPLDQRQGHLAGDTAEHLCAPEGGGLWTAHSYMYTYR